MGGGGFLCLPASTSVCLSILSKWLCVFLRPSARWHVCLTSRSPSNICQVTASKCQGLCKPYRFRNIRSDSCQERSRGSWTRAWFSGPNPWHYERLLQLRDGWFCGVVAGSDMSFSPELEPELPGRRRRGEGAEDAELSADKCILSLFIQKLQWHFGSTSVHEEESIRKEKQEVSVELPTTHACTRLNDLSWFN